jgi:hypothetical protein
MNQAKTHSVLAATQARMAELCPIQVRYADGSFAYNASEQQVKLLLDNRLGEPVGKNCVKYIRLRSSGKARTGRLPVAADSITTFGAANFKRQHDDRKCAAYRAASKFGRAS